VKYLILIHSNPASRAIWEGFSDEQRAEGFQTYGALYDDLAASGELIVSEALAHPSLAADPRPVRIAAQDRAWTDGHAQPYRRRRHGPRAIGRP